jgi:hypothetical protein
VTNQRNVLIKQGRHTSIPMAPHGTELSIDHSCNMQWKNSNKAPPPSLHHVIKT